MNFHSCIEAELQYCKLYLYTLTFLIHCLKDFRKKFYSLVQIGFNNDIIIGGIYFNTSSIVLSPMLPHVRVQMLHINLY